MTFAALLLVVLVTSLSVPPAAAEDDPCLEAFPPDYLAIYGSKLLHSASRQWEPTHCTNSARPWFRHFAGSEARARWTLGDPDVAAAYVSRPVTDPALDVAYVPRALTGFGIGFLADGATGELSRLRLAPHLVAKLLAESYPATPSLGREHRDASGGLDLVDNPLTVTADPEFVALNPDVVDRGQASEAVLLSLSEDSDTMHALTSRVAADARAMAFLSGEPDEYGMRVAPVPSLRIVPRTLVAVSTSGRVGVTITSQLAVDLPLAVARDGTYSGTVAVTPISS